MTKRELRETFYTKNGELSQKIERGKKRKNPDKHRLDNECKRTPTLNIRLVNPLFLLKIEPSLNFSWGRRVFKFLLVLCTENSVIINQKPTVSYLKIINWLSMDSWFSRGDYLSKSSRLAHGSCPPFRLHWPSDRKNTCPYSRRRKGSMCKGRVDWVNLLFLWKWTVSLIFFYVGCLFSR